MFCHATLLLLTVSAACADSAIVKGGARIAKNQNKERKDKQKLAKASNMISIANEDEQNDGMAINTMSFYNNIVDLAKTYMGSTIQATDFIGSGNDTMHIATNDFLVKDIINDVGPDGTDKMHHVRLERLYGGLRVIGGDSVVHIDAIDNTLSSITQTISEPIKVDASEIASVQVAMSSANSKELVIFAHQMEPTLAWDETKHGTASDGTPMVVHYIVDATTGVQIYQFSETKTLHPTGWPKSPLSNEVEGSPGLDEIDALAYLPPFCLPQEAIGIGHTQYSGEVNLSANSIDGVHKLWDTKRNCHYTVNYQGNPTANQSDYYLTDDYYSTFGESVDNKWGDGTSSDSNTAAADAHFGHAATFDFYKNVFGRQGVFNNHRGIHSRVHVGVGYANAYWVRGKMSYGDGDDVFNALTTVDIVAHELTHGVTEATANLIYSGESGGLNEASSDIMGVSVDFYTTNRSVYEPNYLIGEQVVTATLCNVSTPAPGLFLRSMIQPSDDYKLFCQSQSYDCYCPEVADVDVHFSSGVANHFFYLLAEGTVKGNPSRTCNVDDCQIATGTETLIGIGIEKARAIWYRALTVYFTSSTDYLGARDATIMAASDLFTGKEVAAVEDAWTAVNVVPPPPPTMFPSAKPSKTPAPTITAQPTTRFPLFELELKTDAFPFETSWTLSLVGPSKNVTVAQRDFNYYTDTGKIYKESVQLNTDGTYEFTIADEYGDGICCLQANGHYILKLDGVAVKEGGKFDSSETYKFVVSTRIQTPAPIPKELKKPKKSSQNKPPAITPTLSPIKKQTKKPEKTQTPPPKKH